MFGVTRTEKANVRNLGVTRTEKENVMGDKDRERKCPEKKKFEQARNIYSINEVRQVRKSGVHSGPPPRSLREPT